MHTKRNQENKIKVNYIDYLLILLMIIFSTFIIASGITLGIVFLISILVLFFILFGLVMAGIISMSVLYFYIPLAIFNIIISEFNSTTLSNLATIATILGVGVAIPTLCITKKSLKATENTTKADFIFNIYEKYSSDDMLSSLRTLEKLCEQLEEHNNKMELSKNPEFQFPFDKIRTYHDNKLKNKLQINLKNLEMLKWANEVDQARRKVKMFCFMLLDFKNSGFITDDEFRQASDKSGINAFLFKVVEPLEYLLNPNYKEKPFIEYMNAIQTYNPNGEVENPLPKYYDITPRIMNDSEDKENTKKLFSFPII